MRSVLSSDGNSRTWRAGLPGRAVGSVADQRTAPVRASSARRPMSVWTTIMSGPACSTSSAVASEAAVTRRCISPPSPFLGASVCSNKASLAQRWSPVTRSNSATTGGPAARRPWTSSVPLCGSTRRVTTWARLRRRESNTTAPVTGSNTISRPGRAASEPVEAGEPPWSSSGGPLDPPMLRRGASPAGYLPSRGDKLELVNVSSRQRYRGFVRDYKRRRLDDAAEPGDSQRAARGERRAYVREYLRWLRPYRSAAIALLALALLTTGLQMIEPLFMRFIIDRVLLKTGLDTASRLALLQLAGVAFVAVVILSNVIDALRDYRQRLLNVRVMMSLRRSLFERLLHLPLSTLWDMKTGGILSRLTGDVETTTGLLQMALVSPLVSLIRLAVAVTVLLVLNWRLALTAMAVVPGALLISFTAARRIRPIYRSLRRDVEHIDGRVGETFSGIRIVRAFRRELQELLNYMRGRHTVLRKELFAHRRELVLWTSWGLMQAGVNVVIVWYGGYMNITGGASIGDIMAFQWYTFLLLGPVWQIVNSFSELQRSLAAMERVFDVLAMDDDKPDRARARDAPRVVREITFEDVEFAYREGQPVVRDFAVTVPGGSVVALVGKSGAGKTTVTDLGAPFHDPTRGRILLNRR